MNFAFFATMFSSLMTLSRPHTIFSVVLLGDFYIGIIFVSGPDQLIDRNTGSVPHEQVINSGFLFLSLLIFTHSQSFSQYFHYGPAERSM